MHQKTRKKRKSTNSGTYIVQLQAIPRSLDQVADNQAKDRVAMEEVEAVQVQVEVVEEVLRMVMEEVEEMIFLFENILFL